MAFKLLQTRVTEAEGAEFATVAAAHNLSMFEMLRRLVRATLAEWREMGRPTATPSADAGAIPAVVAERGPLVRAIHEAGVRRAALLHQLDADAAETAVTDPDAADLLRGVAASLREAEYSYDPATRKWTLRVGDVAQSIVAPGFSPNALTVNANAEG